MKKWLAGLAILLLLTLLGGVALAVPLRLPEIVPPETVPVTSPQPEITATLEPTATPEPTPTPEPVYEHLTILIDGAPAPDAMTVDLSRVQTIQLKPTKPVTWKKSTSTRCSIDANGLLTIHKTGSFTITATSADGEQAKISFTVVRRVLSIGIQGKASMSAGQRATFKAAVEPSNAGERRVVWASSDPSVATVSSSGIVNIAKGIADVQTVVITATAKDGSGVVGEFPVTVYPVASSVTILLNGQPVNDQTLDIDLATFSTLQFTATVAPASASQDVTWTSSSRTLATISGGLLEAKRKGTVTVTAEANDGSRVRARCKVNISIISKSVEVSGPYTVLSGKSITLKANVLPSNAVDKKVTWTSSNTAAATVSSSGIVRAGDVSASTQVVITATARDGGSSGNYVVTVIPKASVVNIQRNGADVSGTLFMDSGAVGSTMKLSAAVYPADASQAVTWSSSNSRVATVSADGTLTCRGKGKSLLTVKANDGSRVSRNIYVAVGDFAEMPYYIEVDKGNQVVRVFERGDGSYTHLIRRMICSSGHWGTKFSDGLYNLNGARYDWCLADDHVLWMQYATRINGPFMFHSIPSHGRSADHVKTDYYNRLGTKASSGCIRLLCADAKWIYENVPSGVFVLVAEWARDPAEYGAVSAPPLATSGAYCWDPTDDNPANPYYVPTYTSAIN